MPPVIAGALVSAGVGSATAGIASNVLWSGIMIGLSLLFAPDVPKPEAGRIPFKQAVPNRIRIIGRRRTAGAFMLYYGTPKGTSFDVLALCDGEINQFIQHYLHDDHVDVGADHYVQLGIAGRYADRKVRIETRNGLPTETAYDFIVDALDPDHDNTGIWTADHRGDGIGSAFMMSADAGADDQGKRFPFGLPTYSAIVDATRVYDPRDEDHDALDPATWDFSSNANNILQAMWMLTAPISQGGIGLDMSECFVPVLTKIMAQADICDAIVAKKTGTEPRYESHSLYLYSDDPVEALAATLGAMDGFACENGNGTWTLKAGQWDDDDFSIVFEDRDIISLHVKQFREDEDEVTGVIVKYNSHDHDHVTIDAPVWPRDAYQGGNDRRIRSVEVINCPSGTQAQRLGKRIAHYEMAEFTGTMVTKIYGIAALNKRGATIQCSDHPALANAKVRLLRRELNFSAGTVEFDFQVIDPTVCDAWDPATEEGPTQPDVKTPPDEGFSEPTSLVAVASQIGAAIFVDISFDPGDVAGENTNYLVRWRLSDIGGGKPGGWSNVDFNAGSVERPPDNSPPWIVTMNGMPEALLDFQLQAYQHDRSEWSQLVKSDARFSAPGRPNAFTAVLSGADVVLNWNAPNSANFNHARVYRATSGAGFALASDISGEIAGSQNDPMTFTDLAPASATYDYWVVAENSADVASLPRGPETVTVP